MPTAVLTRSYNNGKTGANTAETTSMRKEVDKFDTQSAKLAIPNSNGFAKATVKVNRTIRFQAENVG